MTTFGLQKPEDEIRRVGFVLETQGIHERIEAQVGLNIDVSGSMKELYEKGVAQSALERVLSVALNFDEDGRIQHGHESEFVAGKRRLASIDSFVSPFACGNAPGRAFASLLSGAVCRSRRQANQPTFDISMSRWSMCSLIWPRASFVTLRCSRFCPTLR
ncbi:VWA domain-containing protein [Rhizobium tubonense]|uniref:vWA found in TerF C terminus domain-containing protein n=1 Tax=Rhizobium tubonense TaxID=484088 RepID=A0A2W4EWA4_9HYPH|nr:VWA domain-containing protein [Rhizobium tubonense]PZM14893.1 hypothetical protein CPY51_09380 [Rhizobium tubonense]